MGIYGIKDISETMRTEFEELVSRVEEEFLRAKPGDGAKPKDVRAKIWNQKTRPK